MNRRRFLQLAAGAGVTAATMAEVGFFAEFVSWVKRLPKWSFPSTLNVLTADKIRAAVDSLANAAPSGDFVGIIHPHVAYDLLGNDEWGPLSHLSLRDLATVYYDKTAIENLKRNMTFAEACQEIEASVIRTKQGTAILKATAATDVLPNPMQHRFDHSDEVRLAYAKDENYKTRRVVYNQTSTKIDLLPTTSLAFRT